jgi:hypothetical protein
MGAKNPRRTSLGCFQLQEWLTFRVLLQLLYTRPYIRRRIHCGFAFARALLEVLMTAKMVGATSGVSSSSQGNGGLQNTRSGFERTSDNVDPRGDEAIIDAQSNGVVKPMEDPTNALYEFGFSVSNPSYPVNGRLPKGQEYNRTEVEYAYISVG